MSLVPPALHDRVVVITGATAGIGQVTAVELGKLGATVIICARSAEKTKPVLEQVKAAGAEGAEHVPLDLASLKSVRAAAQGVLAHAGKIDLLINNAGIAGYRGITEDGFEIHFGTNHVGHFLFTTLLLPKLRESKARVVTVASRAHYRAKQGIDFEAMRQKTKTLTGFPEYSVSKLANVLFSAELARREKDTGVHSYSLHPGVVASDLWRRVPPPFSWLMKLGMISNEEGAKTTLHCATSPAVAAETGLYYDECQPRTPSRWGRDEALAAELWKRTETWIGL